MRSAAVRLWERKGQFITYRFAAIVGMMGGGVGQVAVGEPAVPGGNDGAVAGAGFEQVQWFPAVVVMKEQFGVVEQDEWGGGGVDEGAEQARASENAIARGEVEQLLGEGQVDVDARRGDGRVQMPEEGGFAAAGGADDEDKAMVEFVGVGDELLNLGQFRHDRCRRLHAGSGYYCG